PGEHPVKTVVRLLTPWDGTEEDWERSRRACEQRPQAIVSGQYRANLDGDVVRVGDPLGSSGAMAIKSIAGESARVATTGYMPEAILRHWPIVLRGAPRE